MKPRADWPLLCLLSLPAAACCLTEEAHPGEDASFRPLGLCIARFKVAYSRLPLLIGLILGFLPSALFGGDFTLTRAELERSSGKTILMTVNFKKLNPTDLESLAIARGNADSVLQALVRLLDICVSNSESDQCEDGPLKARYFRYENLDETPLTSQSETLLADIDSNSIVFEDEPVDATLNVTAQIRLESQDPTAPFTSSTRVSTRILYGTSPEIDNVAVSYSKGVSETPQNTEARGSKNSLTAIWRRLDQVSREGSSPAPASGMLAILVPPSSFETPDLFPSFIYNDDFEQQKLKSSCSLSVDQDALTCSVNCQGAEKQLIAPADLDTLSGEGIRYTIASGNTATFTDLDNTLTYAIVLQYLPDGLARSCVVGQPSDALILTELTTGKVPTAGDSYCFVATAAYGSPLHAHLDTLRWFRDEFLLPFSWGMALVRSYYQYGPEAAAYIADKPTLRALVRGALWTPVRYIESYRQHPLVTLVLTVAALSLIVLLFRRRALRTV